MIDLIHREPESHAELVEKRIIVRKQRMDILHQGACDAGEKLVWVICPCGCRLSVVMAFRCFYCGVFFCKVCGATHFAEGKE